LDFLSAFQAIILPFENMIIAKILKSFVIEDKKVVAIFSGKQNTVICGIGRGICWHMATCFPPLYRVSC